MKNIIKRRNCSLRKQELWYVNKNCDTIGRYDLNINSFEFETTWMEI